MINEYPEVDKSMQYYLTELWNNVYRDRMQFNPINKYRVQEDRGIMPGKHLGDLIKNYFST